MKIFIVSVRILLPIHLCVMDQVRWNLPVSPYPFSIFVAPTYVLVFIDLDLIICTILCYELYLITLTLVFVDDILPVTAPLVVMICASIPFIVLVLVMMLGIFCPPVLTYSLPLYLLFRLHRFFRYHRHPFHTHLFHSCCHHICIFHQFFSKSTTALVILETPPTTASYATPYVLSLHGLSFIEAIIVTSLVLF